MPDIRIKREVGPASVTPRELARIIRHRITRSYGRSAIVYATETTVYSCGAATRQAAKVLAEQPFCGKVVGFFSMKHSVDMIADKLASFLQKNAAKETSAPRTQARTRPGFNTISTHRAS